MEEDKVTKLSTVEPMSLLNKCFSFPTFKEDAYIYTMSDFLLQILIPSNYNTWRPKRQHTPVKNSSGSAKNVIERIGGGGGGRMRL